MNKYYDDPEYNAAFERFIDLMVRIMLKYGPNVLENQEKQQSERYMYNNEKSIVKMGQTSHNINTYATEVERLESETAA